MKVKYFEIMAADCTSDPHPVDYSGTADGKMAEAMLNDIVRVCESDMVMHVESVRGAIGNTQFESDSYGNSNLYDKKKGPATTDLAKKHKVYGLYHWSDPYFEGSEELHRHLPPGLTGVKAFVKEALKNPKELTRLSIGVTWTFAGDSSCSDYIEINGEYTSPGEVNYGSQDWWIDNEGYIPWCDQMEQFLNKEFPRSTPSQK